MLRLIRVFQLIGLIVVIVAVIVGVGDDPVNGGTVETLPFVQVNSSVDMVSPPTEVFTLAWDQVTYGDANMFDAAAPTQLRAPETCLYWMLGQVSMQDVYEGGETQLYIVRNGVEADIVGITQSEWQDIQVVASAVLEAGDYVELRAYVWGEGSRRVWRTGDANPSFAMVCVERLE